MRNTPKCSAVGVSTIFMMPSASEIITVNLSLKTEKIKFGVPQGSILGPILFLLYINDLQYASALMSILFADDTTLTASNNDIKSLFQHTNFELEKVTDWFLANKLALHPAKCKFILFFPPNSSEIPTFQIMVKDIERVYQSGKEKYFKYVGIRD